MDLRPTPVVRFLRGLVLGTVVVAFGTAAHALADGRVPGVPALAAATALSVLVATTLLERPAGTAFVVSLTVAGQALVHAWLTITAGHGGGHAADDALAHLAADLAPGNAPMLLAHLLAAALVGLWLAAGERALWTLVSLALARLLSFRALLADLAAVVLPVPAPPARPADPAPPPRPVRLARVVVRRGPPLLLAA